MRLDFFVVGAQKAGTTTVHEYLKTHPKIYLPIEKETRYFSENISKGISWYINNFYKGSSPEQLKGEVCPDYMMYDSVPERIKEEFPKSKVILCLRNPVDRAYSHYKMSFLRKREAREFKLAVHSLMFAPKDNIVDRNFDYLKFGEYGRILEGFLEYFESDSIYIVFFEELIDNPDDEVKKIVKWLGEDPHLLGRDDKQAFNQSKEIRFSIIHSFIVYLQKSKSIKLALSMIVSRRKLRGIAKWIKYEVNTKEANLPCLESETREELVNYYQADIKKLEFLIDRPVPWEEYKA